MNLDISCKFRKKWFRKSIQFSDINRFLNNHKVESTNVEKLLRKLAKFKEEKVSKVEIEEYRGFFISLGNKPNLIMIDNNLKSVRIYARSVRDLMDTLRIFLNSLKDIKIEIKRFRKDNIILSGNDVFEIIEFKDKLSYVFVGGLIAQLISLLTIFIMRPIDLIAQLILLVTNFMIRPNDICIFLLTALIYFILYIIWLGKKSNKLGLKYAT